MYLICITEYIKKEIRKKKYYKYVTINDKLEFSPTPKLRLVELLMHLSLSQQLKNSSGQRTTNPFPTLENVRGLAEEESGP